MPAAPGPPAYYAGSFKAFVPRVPVKGDERLRRFTDQVAAIFQSLQRQGQLVQTDVQDYVVLAADQAGFTAENKSGGSLVAGMAVAVHSSGTGFVKADATDTSKPAVGLVTIAAAAGFTVAVDTDGLVVLSDWSAVTEEAAATLSPHAKYYASPLTPGKITLTAPTVVGHTVTRLGQAISPSTLMLEVGPSILL